MRDGLGVAVSTLRMNAIHSDIACPRGGRILPSMLTLRPLPPRPDGPPGFAEPSYRPFERPADASTWSEKPEGAERPYGGAWDYLGDWLAFPRDLISAFRAGTAAPPYAAERLAYLLARTESTVAAGLDVPLERLVRAKLPRRRRPSAAHRASRRRAFDHLGRRRAVAGPGGGVGRCGARGARGGAEALVAEAGAGRDQRAE
jgi:hypothetical protein